MYANLRAKGFLSVTYIDDSYLQGSTYDECLSNIICTRNLFTDLGFLVHPDKSVFIPQQHIVFLGFVLNSVTMTVSLTKDKTEFFFSSVKKFKATCNNLFTIRNVAELIGMLISYSVALPLVMLYTRILEREKAEALVLAKGEG